MARRLHTLYPTLGNELLARVRVVKIHDGDSLRFLLFEDEPGRIVAEARLWIVNAPERLKRCIHEWQRGRELLQTRLESLSHVTLLARRLDKYGRFLSIVWRSGDLESINAWLIGQPPIKPTSNPRYAKTGAFQWADLRRPDPLAPG